MGSKIPVGVLGATGMVGQRFVRLLQDHPWFELTVLTGSERRAGRPYEETCEWVVPGEMPVDNSLVCPQSSQWLGGGGPGGFSCRTI